jgi:uncharacterized damage-inducible protein DinB
MNGALLKDAFAHHIWATLRLIEACGALGPEQLGTTVPGTYGSVMDTIRHLVEADCWYLFAITGERSHLIDEKGMDLPELGAATERNGAAWSRLLGGDLDPDAVLREVDEGDGYEMHAPIGVRLAQALHHGTDHRSQVCTALTSLGVEPPDIDVWCFGLQTGRSFEVLPGS